MGDFYDRSGKSMTLEEWAVAFENGDRHIGKTEIGDSLVSTVWLGSDHQFGEGPPLIFETMVFGGPLDQEMERYSTEQEAEAGHARWVAKVQGT